MKIDALKTFKQRSEKITCLTAYDASFASVLLQTKMPTNGDMIIL
jgi:ketopantoate hydroxymethyltransferase